MTANVYLPPSPHHRFLYNAIDPILNADIKTTLLITTLCINPN